jgi:hypothetical protein
VALRWRPQLAPKPARCFPRLHGIDKFDHKLMKVTASGALEGSDAKTGRTQRDLCPHRSLFVIWTGWFVKHAHDVVALHQGGSTTLSVTG